MSRSNNKNKKNNREKSRSNANRHKERKFKRGLAPESSAKSDLTRLAVAPPKSVEKLLRGIGTPEPAPFVPDNFQTEALQVIEFEDVLVTAPTGSGKTWIAREEIRRLLEQGKRAWYTTPLKALTNSKYVEFSNEFGAENVGILTGDRKKNYNAPLIVGTTEIYRNQLFDALRSGEQVNTDFVIFRRSALFGGRGTRSRLGGSDNFVAAANSSAFVIGNGRKCRRICALDRRGARRKSSRH